MENMSALIVISGLVFLLLIRDINWLRSWGVISGSNTTLLSCVINPEHCFSRQLNRHLLKRICSEHGGLDSLTLLAFMIWKFACCLFSLRLHESN
jgi:hypothetical protein